MTAIDIPTTERGPKLLEEMTCVEVADALKRSDVAILTPSAIEQHGVHLPLGTDWYIGLETTRRSLRVLAERGHQAVGYAFPIGKSDNFMSFAGTLTLSNATFVAVQKELIGCLYAHGFRRFVLLSANGGNANGMQTAADEIHKELGCPLLFVDPLPYQFSYKNEVLKNAKIDHHGAEGETAKILVTHADLVHQELADFWTPVPGSSFAPTPRPGVRRYSGRWEDFAPGGVVGDPRLAEAATGEILYERNAAWIADVIEAEFFAEKA